MKHIVIIIILHWTFVQTLIDHILFDQPLILFFTWFEYFKHHLSHLHDSERKIVSRITCFFITSITFTKFVSLVPYAIWTILLILKQLYKQWHIKYILINNLYSLLYYLIFPIDLHEISIYLSLLQKHLTFGTSCFNHNFITVRVWLFVLPFLW